MLTKIILAESEVNLEDIVGLLPEAADSYAEVSSGITDIEDLCKPECIQSIRNTLFNYDINYKIHGLRLIIDITPGGFGSKTYVTTKPVAAQNFTDWLTPKADWTPGATGGFFEKCAQMALGKIPANRQITFLDQAKTVFTTDDDHPKAPFHQLIMTTQQHDNLLDPTVTISEWQDLFRLIYTVFNKEQFTNQDIRIVFNCGQGMQRGNWLVGHLLADQELMHFDPQYYGFSIDPDKYCIQAEPDNELYCYLQKTILAFEQATDRQEKIRLGQMLKNFLNSRVQFH